MCICGAHDSPGNGYLPWKMRDWILTFPEKKKTPGGGQKLKLVSVWPKSPGASAFILISPVNL